MKPCSKISAAARDCIFWLTIGASFLSSTAWAKEHVPLLWETEVKTGYEFGNAVASGEGRIATVGTSYTGDCAAGFCGLDASVRVQDAATGELKWSLFYDYDQTEDRNEAVAIRDHVVIVAGFTNGAATFGHEWMVVSAFALDSGRLLWRDVLGDSSTDYYPWQIAIHEGRAFVTGVVGATCVVADGTTCDQFTRTYDLVTGRVIATLRDDVSKGGDDEALSVSVSKDRMFIGGLVGEGPNDAVGPSVRAYDIASGELIWKDQPQDSTQDGAIFKVVSKGNKVVAAGIANEEWLVRAYDSRTGAIRWSQSYSLLGTSVPGVFNAPIQLAMDEQTVLVAGYGSTEVYGTEAYPKASRDWVVRAYDLETGRLLWSDHSGSPVDADEAEGGAVLAGGRAYALGFLTDDEGVRHTVVRAYDARSGQVIWNDEVKRYGYPTGITTTLAAADGLLTAVSLVQGTRPPNAPIPDSFGQDLLVRTYVIGQ